jgi:hypothetical protein
MRINRPMVAIFSCASLLLGFLPCMSQQVSSAANRLPALSYAVEDIIKLSRADISETVILNYIDTSGSLYDLKPRDVIRLRDEGVKDSVINAMIDQRRKFETNAAPTVAPEPAPAPAVQSPCPVSCNLCGGPMYCKREPISTLYVIPYTSSRPAYASYGYGNWGNWGSYYYYGPWQRPFRGPWLYRCGHWHGCNHRHY